MTQRAFSAFFPSEPRMTNGSTFISVPINTTDIFIKRDTLFPMNSHGSILPGING